MTRMMTATAFALATALPTLAAAQATAPDAQYAAQIGVDASKYSLTELVALDKALRDDNRQGANQILSDAGSELTYNDLISNLDANGMTIADVEVPEVQIDAPEGKAQLAASIGVDPEAFTLTQLVALKSAIDTSDEDEVQNILDEVGVDRTALSVM